MTKRNILFGVFILIISSIFYCNKNSDKQAIESSKATINYDSINRVALQKIKEEPKVKDAVITDAKVLYASVIDDGTIRNGYADYLCIVLKEEKSNVERVKIIAYGTSKSPKRDNAYGILIGETWCE